MASRAHPIPVSANDQSEPTGIHTVSPVSKELVIALVGYAGAGTSTAGDRIAALLESEHYQIKKIKFSDLIGRIDGIEEPEPLDGNRRGRSKFDRAVRFQDRGDAIRDRFGNHALSAAAVKLIREGRGVAEPGKEKIAYILDSLKHPDEVSLLRRVYGKSFRLVAVHCGGDERLSRLFGPAGSTEKYAGVDRSELDVFTNRDAKDENYENGQRVRDVFHLADFFLDNSVPSQHGAGMNDDIDRFISLLLGNGMVRPTGAEKAIYVAFASALQSACLSRQVGAALISNDGRLVATGKNDPPKFGGGTYDEDSLPDNRCFAWEFQNGELAFVGCHNDRKKSELYRRIASWMADRLPQPMAKRILPIQEFMGTDQKANERSSLEDALAAAFGDLADEVDGMPGIKDAIEYSRSIHAEMAVLMAAARGGISTKQSTMYVTVFPCHNCARHLVAAGVSAVYYIEPYVKSLAFELHSDSISQEGDEALGENQFRMKIAPFTGVGPRMYDDFFVKRGDLKGLAGIYQPQAEGEPFSAVRLRALEGVEDAASELVQFIK
jgi:deoxycytidylate deaminase